ncbi:hypothetical protein CSUB01_03486 [Colletotrichum sublineola]|uniref:Uncharacterized protein n=1 Tax=Colletotrichum sublineola TaxID=1173701 RepID=A0A066X3J6_COLSU|nr:hypothetical protein CSUB01_03486 [Colletotrichum sublineola]
MDQTPSSNTEVKKYELNSDEINCIYHNQAVSKEPFYKLADLQRGFEAMGFIVVRSVPADDYVQFEASGGTKGLLKFSKEEAKDMFENGCCKRSIGSNDRQ